MDQDNLPRDGWLSGWGALLRVKHWSRVTSSLFFDPSAAFSGFIAGVTARSVVVLTDNQGWTAPPANRRVQQMPDTRNMATRINRRGLLYSLLFWCYIPVHRMAQFESVDPHVTKERFKITLWAAVFSTIMSRLLVNIWSNIADASMQKGLSKKIAYKYLTRHENLPGLTTLFVSQPPVWTSILYHGTIIVLFEMFRRYFIGHETFEEDVANRSKPLLVVKNAVQNGFIAAGCSTMASGLTLMVHRSSYRQELSRPTALNFPVKFLWRREAVLVGCTFGFLSLCQPFLSPHHSRCGFGY